MLPFYRTSGLSRQLCTYSIPFNRLTKSIPKQIVDDAIRRTFSCREQYKKIGKKMNTMRE